MLCISYRIFNLDMGVSKVLLLVCVAAFGVSLTSAQWWGSDICRPPGFPVSTLIRINVTHLLYLKIYPLAKGIISAKFVDFN